VGRSDSRVPDGKGGYIKAWSLKNDPIENLDMGDGIRLYGDDGGRNGKSGGSWGDSWPAYFGLLGLGFLGGLSNAGSGGVSEPTPRGVPEPVPGGVRVSPLGLTMPAA
jgi:hypothetical protein